MRVLFVFIGQRFETSAALLIVVGIAVIVFGLLTGVNFFTEKADATLVWSSVVRCWKSR